MHIYSVATASSIVLAVLLAMVILRSRSHNRQMHRYLGFILIVFSLCVASNAKLALLALHDNASHHILYDPFQLLLGPLFYFYLCKVNDLKVSLTIKCVHFIPCFIAALYLALTLFNYSTLIGAYWIGILIYVQLWVYYFLCQRQLKNYREKLKHSCSTIEKINETWIAQSLFALMLGYSGVTIVYLLNHGLHYLPVNQSLAIVYALIIYLVAYKTIKRPEIFASLAPNEHSSTMADELEPEIVASVVGSKYNKSGLTNADLEAIYIKLQAHMQNAKPFIDPALNLQLLSKQLELRPHHLSQAINHANNANFYDFINAYRIDEVKRQLADPSQSGRSIISIAYDAGFNAKATFNRLFRRATGKTPSAYRKSAEFEPTAKNKPN